MVSNTEIVQAPPNRLAAVWLHSQEKVQEPVVAIDPMTNQSQNFVNKPKAVTKKPRTTC
jgi:hypothetical protein